MKLIKKFESYTQDREMMCKYLSKCGYSSQELEVCSEEELRQICKKHEDDENQEMLEESNKSKNNKKDTSKVQVLNKKEVKKTEAQKLSIKEIDSELQALKSKDLDTKKKGVQGLNKQDLKKYRQLTLSKNLRGLKEHQQTRNYMFFSNLHSMRNHIDQMLEMDESMLDNILTEHDWASDHISVAGENVEHVFNFVSSHTDSEEDSMSNNIMYSEPSEDDIESLRSKTISSFSQFKK
jgi:hypothetical protein